MSQRKSKRVNAGLMPGRFCELNDNQPEITVNKKRPPRVIANIPDYTPGLRRILCYTNGMFIIVL